MGFEFLDVMFRGICVGVAASITVGPVAVLCIQRTLSKSRRSGIVSGLGVACADTFMAMAALFFYSMLQTQIEQYNTLLRVIGGIFVVAFHLLVVTNIDNLLRPWLVPKAARLDPALMLLAVFAGISMFGFFGLVIGPVLMIIIVTTVSVYLAVYKGVELEMPEPEEPRKHWWSRRRELEKVSAPAAESTTETEEPPSATPPSVP